MPVVKPQPGDLEAIEKASRDEISALQLQRLQATLQHPRGMQQARVDQRLAQNRVTGVGERQQQG